MLINLRVAFAYCFMMQLLTFSLLSMKVFVSSSYKSSWLCWSSALIGCIIFLFMIFELLGVFYNRQSEISGLNKAKALMFTVLQAIQKIKNKEAGTIKKNMFAEVERDFIGFEMVDLKYSTKKMDEKKLISLEEEFYELNKQTGELKPVRVSLVKKIADPELDNVIFRMTFVNVVTPLSVSVVVALFPTYPLL